MANGHKSVLGAEVRTGLGQTAYKRGLAYKRLGINPRDVQHIPFLRAELRRIARCVNRGLHKDEPAVSPVRPLDYLQSSEYPDARSACEHPLLFSQVFSICSSKSRAGERVQSDSKARASAAILERGSGLASGQDWFGGSEHSKV